MIFKLKMTDSYWRTYDTIPEREAYESLGFQYKESPSGRVKLLDREVNINIESIDEILKIIQKCDEDVVIGFQRDGIPFIEIYNGYRE